MLQALLSGNIQSKNKIEDLSSDYFTSNISQVVDAQQKYVHLKIESLNDIQLQSLESDAQNYSQNKQIKISFKRTSISIEQKQINILADILNKQIQYDQILIQNRYSNGSQQNLLTLVSQLNCQNILKLSLDMKSNDLNKEEAEKLAEEISRLTNLQKLSLVFSYHTSQSCYLDCISNIAQKIKIQKLVLSLEKTPISPTNFEELVNKISEIDQLRSLKLKINGDLLAYQQLYIVNRISSKIQNLEKLSLIIDSSSKENSKIDSQMELEVDINHNLKLILEIQIDNQSLFGFKLLNSFLNLRKLNLNLKNLTESDQLEYSQLISKQNQLEELKVFFSNSQFSEKLTQEFQKNLSNLASLKKLDIQYNLEKNYSQFHLPKILEKLIQIKELKLQIISDNFGDLTEISEKQLYGTLNLLKNLQSLYLKVPLSYIRANNNYFQIFFHQEESLLKMISQCINLSSLTISFGRNEGRTINKKIRVRLTNPQNLFQGKHYREVQDDFFTHIFKSELKRSKLLLKKPKLVSISVI